MKKTEILFIVAMTILSVVIFTGLEWLMWTYVWLAIPTYLVLWYIDYKSHHSKSKPFTEEQRKELHRREVHRRYMQDANN